MKPKKRLITAVLLITIKTNAMDCFDKAGYYYKIDPDYLRAIAYQESKFNHKAINDNGLSKDIGLMQINTNNLPKLKKYFPNISIKNLLEYPCFNISVGAYLLNENFRMYGKKWLAVGMYNAGMSNKGNQAVKRLQYAKKIDAYYNLIKQGTLILPNVN